MDHDIGSHGGQQRQRCRVVTQFAVVVVLDDEDIGSPGEFDELHASRRGHARPDRKLVRRCAIHRRDVPRQQVDPKPSRVDRYRKRPYARRAERADGPLIAGILDRDRIAWAQ